jgi:MoaA/NifB/PqqE/SkfB family radical SAM enzyme
LKIDLDIGVQTFCSYLWEGIYINRSGEVFACCHQKPVPYGNIYNAPLVEIINSSSALQLRSDSLKGELSCYPFCNLLDKEKSFPQSNESSRIDYKSLKRLHISFGESCNIRCIMCNNPQNHAANPILLDPKVVIRNVDVTPFVTVMLRGGEPLVQRQCLEYIDYLEEIGKPYTILTNGILIDEERAQRLAEHAHSVIVSLNGATKEVHESVNKGSCFEKVLKNVMNMKRARDSVGSKLIITGHMTITTSNIQEVALFLRMFKKLGFDRVNFGYVKETVPEYLASHPEFTRKLKEDTTAAKQEVSEFDVDALRLKLLGLWQPPPSENFSPSGLNMVELSPALDQDIAGLFDRTAAPQTVIGDSMMNTLKQIDYQCSAIAFIRHSERDKAPSPANVDIDDVPLTKRGMELARRFGRNLQGYAQVSVSHTSISRSIQTAEEIHAGLMESHPESKPVLKGRDPVFSVIYRGTINKNLRDAYRAGLRGQAFTQMWLNGEVNRTIMRPAKETIERFLADIETRIRNAPPRSLHIHIGHDREIEVVRTFLLGGRPGDFPMMGFLDGLVFYAQKDSSTRVRWRNRIVELRTDSTAPLAQISDHEVTI